MNLGEMIRYVLSRAGLHEGERTTENLIVSALNSSYLEIAEKLPMVSEYDYYVMTKVLQVPEDYLVDISLNHSSLGYLSKPTMYTITGNSIVLSDDIISSGNSESAHLIYGICPTLLSSNSDIPQIPSAYHNALCLYALYVLTSQELYFAEYTNILTKIPPILSPKDKQNYCYGIEDVTRW